MADPRVDANSASYRELRRLPGVGEATASQILELRPFLDLRDLRKRVRGVGESREKALGRLLRFGPSAAASARENHPATMQTLVDVNRASLEDLEALNGIGKVLAQRIVDARPFYRVDDLLGLKGIKDATLSKFRHRVCVGELPPRGTQAGRSAPDRALNSTGTTEVSTRSSNILSAQPLYENDHDATSSEDGASDDEEDLYEEYFRQLEQLEETAASEWIETELYRSRSADAFVLDERFPVCQEVDTDVREHVFDQQRTRRQRHEALIGVYQNHYDCTPEDLHRDPVVLVASWNIRNVSKRKSSCYLERIATIINQFDLVALQEVRDERVLIKLKRFLPGWGFVKSEPVGETGRRTELFAYFYRRQVVAPTDSWELETTADLSVVRAPFVAHFTSQRRSKLSRPLELTLVNVHVCFSTRHIRREEGNEIRKFADDLVASIPPEGRSVVVLGDFNLAPIDMLGGEQTNFAALIRPPLSTTVFGSLYDNIWIDPLTTNGNNRHARVDACGVFRIDWRFYPLSRTSTRASKFPASESIVPREQIELARMQCAIELSDHCPVWAALTS